MLDQLTVSQSEAVSISAGKRNVRLTPTDGVRAFWGCRSRHTARGLLCGHGGARHHLHCAHRVAAPRSWPRSWRCIQDIVLPVVEGEGSLAQALWERLVDGYSGRTC
jgi:hypothetical protein